MKVKICGITCMEDVQILNGCLPDYAGFVFAKSKRQVTKEQAKRLIGALDQSIAPVGVFVNEAVDKAAELAAFCSLQYIQLHGDEDEIYIRDLRRRCSGIQIIKAVAPRRWADIEYAANLQGDYLLIDSYDQSKRGGTGKTADWALVAKMKENMETAFFLAGGIGPENIEQAMALAPYALDMSSGVEKIGGGKDREKVASVIERMRRG